MGGPMADEQKPLGESIPNVSVVRWFLCNDDRVYIQVAWKMYFRGTEFALQNSEH